MSSNKRVLNMIVDHSTNSIIPKNWDEFKHIIQFFDDKSEVTVTVEPYVRKRSLSQNGLFYKYVQIISDETGSSKETVKQYIKQEHGPRLESGELKSTNDYTTVEMNFMIDRLRQLGEENGIRMPDPEEMRNKNIKVNGK